MIPFLGGQNLMEFIDGSCPRPPPKLPVEGNNAPPKDNPAYFTWTQQDQAVMTTLISSLSEEVIPLIVGCQSFAEIWQVLQTALALPSNTHILNLQLNLQSLDQKDLSVTAYLQRAKGFADELAAAGRPLNTAEFNIYVFKGLRSDFKDLVTTLTACAEPVSYAELHALLLSHEFMNNNSMAFLSLSAATSITLPPPTVNYVQRGTFHSSNRGGGHDRSNRGRNRGRNNRYHNDSRFTSGDYHTSHYEPRPSLSYGGDQRPRYRIYNKTNHSANQCHHRYIQPQPTYPPPSAHLAAHPSANSYQSSSSLNWFPDTGATHHATPDSSQFSHIDEYHGNDQLYAGNGKGLPITHVGSSSIITPSASLSKSLLSVQKFTTNNNVFF